jgi:hypothetical protein
MKKFGINREQNKIQSINRTIRIILLTSVRRGPSSVFRAGNLKA